MHPYSAALMGSIIVPEKGMKERKLVAMQGAPPNLKRLIQGCAFFDRCPYGLETCRESDVAMVEHGGRTYRCVHDKAKLMEYHSRESK
jgi:peptide/nickel transport system ATP-binding protein